MAARVAVLGFTVESLHLCALDPERPRLVVYQLQNVGDCQYTEQYEDIIETATSLPNKHSSDQNRRENEEHESKA